MSAYELRVLVLEDEVPVSALMRKHLEDLFTSDRGRATKKGATPGWMRLNCGAATNLADFSNAIAGQHFHFASLDLRVPRSAGGPVLAETAGLQAYEAARNATPCLPASVYTQFTKDHLASLLVAGNLNVQYWQKAAADKNEQAEVPVLEPPQWAERVRHCLRPYGAAQRHVLESAVPYLPRMLAEPVDELKSACANWSKSHLGPSEFQHAERWRLDHAFDGLWTLCRLSEQCKEWLWNLLAARVCWGPADGVPMALLRKELSDLAQRGWGGKDSIDQQALKERQLNHFIVALGKGADASNPRLLSHLGGNEMEGGDVPVVSAFKALRLLRNRIAHQNRGMDYTQEWEKVSLPFHRLLDLLAYFAAYPLLCDVQHLTDGFYNARMLDTLLSRSVDCKVKGLWDAEPGDRPASRQVYAVWPEKPDQPMLLSLSPWVDRRPGASGAVWDTFFYVGRSAQGKVRDLHSYTSEPTSDLRTDDRRSALLDNLFNS